MRSFGPFHQSDDFTDFRQGTDEDGRLIWSACDIPDDDDAQPQMVVGVGDPDNGGTVIRMSGAVAVRLARALLSSSSLARVSTDDFGFIRNALALPYRNNDPDDSESAVHLDPRFAEFATAAGKDLTSVSGFEWVRVHAAWSDERERAYEQRTNTR